MMALAPGRADACSTSSPGLGLEVWELSNPPERLVTAPGGVVALYGSVFATELTDAAASASVTLERDGLAIATTIELVPLQAEVYLGAPLWTVVVVARPAEPLVAGQYQATAIVESVESGTQEVTFPVVVEAEPLAPLATPTIASFAAAEAQGARRDHVCCEREPDSCGGMSICKAAETELLPALAIGLEALPEARAGNSVVWAQALDAEGQPIAGARSQMFGRHHGEWLVPFAAAQAEYCVTVGATDLVDGTSVASPPRCFGRDEVGEPRVRIEEVTAEEVELWGCLTPPVHEDGTPFGETPAGDEKGCRIGEDGPAWGSLALLGLGIGWRRRRGRSRDLPRRPRSG
ncbi:MYXO-CTERM sorting domain-containing protein [Nannocystis bainbridge]|uniref:MYXO-CTERM sorting domain-containing protein n=1 Tax=Nannocystis bainbridge TaxID=2995303 RepID=A0ABT5ECZ8_9BACT|nr:MYXO-CTERM sorting domain-containing protein [Nannocystis bainbridge]MDC0723313.1 MYXO-CTERM sorting domain-containing protein [Nannocystis bainbridge]